MFFLEKVNNDTYLKVFDSEYIKKFIKPENINILNLVK